jgi:hypothetical protein
MIYNRMKNGEIERMKIGARKLIKVSSLLRLLGVLPMPARKAGSAPAPL